MLFLLMIKIMSVFFFNSPTAAVTDCRLMNALFIFNDVSHNFDREHPVVLIMTVILYIKQSSNTTFSMYFNYN